MLFPCPMTGAFTYLPEGRPYLLERSRALDLMYLSWGRRRYDEAPVPVTAHEGWVCSLILTGSPRLLLADGSGRTIPARRMIVVRPDCASGWQDRKGKTCDQLTWLWRSPVLASRLESGPGYLEIPVEKESAERLRRIHERCREEIAGSDRLTPRALGVLRESLEIELERGLSGESSSNRFEFAVAWLTRHGHEERPVTRLAEYLQISLSTLDRLFHKHAGAPAATWLHHQKMRAAAALLAEGNLSKKQVAYELGYRHPCDFSRAWSRWKQGEKKSAIRKQRSD